MERLGPVADYPDLVITALPVDTSPVTRLHLIAASMITRSRPIRRFVFSARTGCWMLSLRKTCFSVFKFIETAFTVILVQMSHQDYGQLFEGGDKMGLDNQRILSSPSFHSIELP
ncbi:uncharacterized protein BT62DRAFT_623303 [Guyanagaster necrorhizus]|uniref:Uncharacterized protein n=1 Tax=Guyanagaster necrorhizus TaxID=856835 RepID=A0A9P7W0S7_9AGAR|nr:uncharacterized protein BT62DRAFT_623303 [Guyanagaster necrorhizus MCA 3950]KAG7450087.1 hypothetical protein BT62DRAFT_623303 [Guyanagaster necrorhizus MCA 3950]